ncbi:MAG: hypothetical protein CBB96_00860 [Gammaproteobacteria bacterium TMED36]|nr:MAG: hypothetical protein CBB96_00860 [Gammaproteobacteria bacterium TMED36]|tara:strand:+ start:2428 stop:2718 length:291 start_codon:yes stop_codon:yes gene_type:complete
MTVKERAKLIARKRDIKIDMIKSIDNTRIEHMDLVTTSGKSFLGQAHIINVLTFEDDVGEDDVWKEAVTKIESTPIHECESDCWCQLDDETVVNNV